MSNKEHKGHRLLCGKAVKTHTIYALMLGMFILTHLKCTPGKNTLKSHEIAKHWELKRFVKAIKYVTMAIGMFKSIAEKIGSFKSIKLVELILHMEWDMHKGC